MLPPVLCAQESMTPAIEGYITAAPSNAGFDVNGKHIVTTPQTRYMKHIVLNHEDATATDPSLAGVLAIGDDVQVFGRKDRHTHSIVASTIVLEHNP